MPKIKVLSGGGFPEREVNSQTIGSLRDELDMASGSTVAVNGTGVTDDYSLQDGDIVAAVTSNKTGGYWEAIRKVYKTRAYLDALISEMAKIVLAKTISDK